MYDKRFGLIYRSLPSDQLTIAIHPFGDVVAVANTPARLAFFNSTAKPSMGLFRKVLEEQRIHRPLQADG
ncbi:hypothetical protein PMI02_01281 [Novosphingobium sp. AP12]|nr:hypothetical protein PMI02_01281 [Novosphingobium sp. AP12]